MFAVPGPSFRRSAMTPRAITRPPDGPSAHESAGESAGDRRLTGSLGGLSTVHQVLALQTAAGNRAVASALSRPVQRQTPAPAPPVSPPSPAPPGQGPAAWESEPDSLPAPGASLVMPLSAERRFPITKEDLSDFNIGVGEYVTDQIPLGESGVLAKVAIGSESPVSLSDASLVLSPIVGQLDAGDVAKARKAEESGGRVGKTIGRGVGELVAGPLGSIVGGAIGEEVGGWAAGDHFVRFTLTQGALGGSFRVTYNPYLKLTLSVAGFSWLLNATATLQTNLNLVVAPKVDFAGSQFSLTFRGGRLEHTEFDLKPVIAPALELVFDANGQLRAAVNLLPILGKDRKDDEPVDDEGVELAEVVTAPFKFLQYKTVIGGAGVDLHAAKGSPFEVMKKNAKAAGKMPGAVQEFVVKSDKQMPFAPPPELAGPPRTGRSPEQAIPFVWYKPFNRYIPTLNLPASEFGRRHAARGFPSTRYRDQKRGSDITLGVDNWPYRGMVLKKKSNNRGGEVEEFRQQCALHGINLPSGYQIDHVIDLVFEGGDDEFHNLWPLLAEVNTRAGGMWSNGRSLVQWRNRETDPPVRSAPSAVPANRYFVISDIQDPPG